MPATCGFTDRVAAAGIPEMSMQDIKAEMRAAIGRQVNAKA